MGLTAHNKGTIFPYIWEVVPIYKVPLRAQDYDAYGSATEFVRLPLAVEAFGVHIG